MTDAEIWERARRLAKELVVRPSGMFVRIIARELKEVQKGCCDDRDS